MAQTITGLAFRTALQRLNREGLSGLIIDLRGNGGAQYPSGGGGCRLLFKRQPSYAPRPSPSSVAGFPRATKIGSPMAAIP